MTTEPNTDALELFRAVKTALDELKFPILERPAVHHGAPAAPELIHWVIRARRFQGGWGNARNTHDSLAADSAARIGACRKYLAFRTCKLRFFTPDHSVQQPAETTGFVCCPRDGGHPPVFAGADECGASGPGGDPEKNKQMCLSRRYNAQVQGTH